MTDRSDLPRAGIPATADQLADAPPAGNRVEPATAPPAGNRVEPWSDATGARRVRDAFADRFGAPARGVWAAPGRVNLIGEHTDYNNGLCLPIALPHRTFIALRPRSDGEIRLISAQEPGGWSGRLDDIAPGAVQGWAAYAVGVAWALRQAGHDVPGFDAAVDSCVPYGAGLSSSAALESAFAVALDDVAGLGLGADDAGRAHLAAACIRAENEVAGAPTGGMDQAASLRAAAGHALLLDCRAGLNPRDAVEHVPLDLAAGGLALLVIDTRAEHRLVDGQYAARRATCEQAARELSIASLRQLADDPSVEAGTLATALTRLPDDVMRRRVRHVVTEIGRVRVFVARLRAGRPADVGPLMAASHASLRDDYEVSCPELDLAVDAARAAGALGARMTGGGFGGSAIALIRADDAAPVARTVQRAFADAGFAPPAFLLADPAAPAGRIP